MTDRQCILALDQGTTSSRAILFDDQVNQLASAQQEFPQHYPQDGWVEHDPMDIWHSSLTVVRRMLDWARENDYRVCGIGITNQRETTVVWDKRTGRPVYNAIVWQDRRTAEYCDHLKREGVEEELQARSGLLLDPYFSASKINWILDHNPDNRARAERGELLFGTIDSFLIWKLTSGASHLTDATNACRTNLYNIHRGAWDERLLELFRVPVSMLPEVRDCADHFGTTDASLIGQSLPILGVAGDQQAASIGQCCFSKGDIKSTYGTGCFVLLNTGDEAVTSSQRLLTTVAYQLDGKPSYALEGSIFVAGAAVQWLRDELGIIRNAAETETLARSIDSNKGVYLVPAFTGLGVPYWQADARGALFGLTRGSGRAEIARAALEAMAYQTSDLFKAMAADGITPATLRVDGGMVANDWMLQFLADILDTTVIRPKIAETTAVGAAYLAGRQAGLYGDFEAFTELWQCQRQFEPAMPDEQRQKLLSGWADAIKRVLKSAE
ncbi:glycerol kinase GlpK [Marinobacterium mangrovicola]|uniref:Glycerol kinase n=1 Tax=Marinobacterium mangrovicola TaxID=1476959 RepID=A0A4R1G7M5_9GAMM|nr:glycerol kinase GlpK [Marinobacterium mangrovicola]TCK02563.1 glycerol kinase [Marinobacterium mangrovicola]